MTVVGSRYGNDNQYASEPGRGFTVVCNDCGLTLTNKDMTAHYCIYCELIPVITCHGCKQEAHIHDTVLCEREVNYVQRGTEPLGQLRDSKGGEQL